MTDIVQFYTRNKDLKKGRRARDRMSQHLPPNEAAEFRKLPVIAMDGLRKNLMLAANDENEIVFVIQMRTGKVLRVTHDNSGMQQTDDGGGLPDNEGGREVAGAEALPD